MFGRRKSNDGFEWHKYVRTTIKLKREQRRQRIVDARRAAAHQAGEAGVALAAGSRAAGAAAVDGARAGLGFAGLALQALWNIVATVSAIAWHKLAALSAAAGRRLAILLQPLTARLERPDTGGPIALAAAVALALGIGRYSATGFDREAGIALALGVVLLIAALPLLSNLTGIRLPRLSALGISPRLGFIAVTAGVVVAASPGWRAAAGPTSPASRANSPWSGAPSRCRAAPRR